VGEVHLPTFLSLTCLIVMLTCVAQHDLAFFAPRNETVVLGADECKLSC